MTPMRALLCLLFPVALLAADRPPNIVIILADDLGYGDIRAYNPTRGKIATPHLDRLAAEGMRFTDGHSSSGVCSPSRYTLLTGRYHWRTRLQSGIVGVFGEPLIAPDRLTVASLAKRQGYRTAAIGKWHLGWDWPIDDGDKGLFRNYKEADRTAPEADKAAWKKVFAQKIPGGPTTRGFDTYFGTDVPNWPPFCFIENDQTVGIPDQPLPKALLGNNQASVHGPALPEWKLERILPALTARACTFIDEAARKPEPFLLYLPLTTPHTPLAVNEAWKGKSGLNNAAADLIMETDAAVGQVLAALEKSGAAGNTLVLFTSDNGFASYVGAKELEQQGHYPSGPLRGYKSSAFEGGHREPFIVRWPAKVAAGSTCDQLVHHADVIATLAEIWGTALPPEAGEDSFSFLPLLKGATQPIRTHAISCAAAGTPSLRLGNWKYIASQPAELYDLAADLGETKNLAEAQPARLAEMKALLEKLITNGRSSPGAAQKNDIKVVRFPKSAQPKAKTTNQGAPK
ncbi:MAG: arylsulfatase [Opitutia bacterium AMD-G3]|jgi:arylsulfatase A-like enzyme|nr:MAG: arylsulfatase [Opitutae bacterium AMD-G3]